jgi:hypothetical protein
MARYDDIEEVRKNVDEIEEVEKFNPFHDSIGRFASSHGFKSYSANPKTKAGAMAIQRSAAAGHGRTLNVHRESKGESIAQNDNWLKTGQKPKTPAAVSRARYQQRKQKLQAQQAQQNQQAQQKPAAKPAQSKQTVNNTQNGPQSTKGNLASDVANVKLTSSQKLALQARDANGSPTKTIKVANDNYQDRVAGKDISKTFDYSKVKNGKAPIDAIADAQGWNKGPTVTNDRDVFDKAAKQAGRVLIRTVQPSQTGQTSTEVARSTMTDGNYALGGHGAQAYGSGRYMVDTKISGNSLTANRVAAGQQESFWYGDKQLMATVHPNAKIATPTQSAQLRTEFHNLSSKQRARFGNDANTYIASKGYDGAKWHVDSDPTAYTTMFNNSAMIYYGGVASNY